MNKKNIFLICFLIVFFGTAYIQYKNSFTEKKIVSVTPILVKQTIAGNDEKKQVAFKVKKGNTALQVLKSSHTIITKGEKENAYVLSIDKRVASDEKKEFWAFYVNGKQAQVGAGSYILKNNDTIEWKIETY